jgi:hypothetical protein
VWDRPPAKYMMSGGRVSDIKCNPKDRTFKDATTEDNVNLSLNRSRMINLLKNMRQDGANPILARSMKEFWPEEEFGAVLNMLSIGDQCYDGLDLEQLIEVGKTIDLSYSDVAAEGVFNATKDQSKSQKWHTYR